MDIKCYLRTATGVFDGQSVIYPAAVDAGRIGDAEFINSVVKNQNISHSTAAAALSAIADELKKMLALGHTVDVPGLGSFSVDVKGKVVEDELGKRSIADGKASVRFYPDQELRKGLKDSRLVLESQEVVAGQEFTREQSLSVARQLIEENGYFVQRQYADKAGISISRACKVLAELAAQDLIGYDRSGHVIIYNKVNA